MYYPKDFAELILKLGSGVLESNQGPEAYETSEIPLLQPATEKSHTLSFAYAGDSPYRLNYV
jgi:hypothetical protein